VNIKAKTLTGKSFSKYGEAIFVGEGQKPDSNGEGWECWYPLAEITKGRDFSFGLVASKPKTISTRFLERHLDREEYVIALGHPLIQIVGSSANECIDQPDIAKTEAFLLKPGQIVKINPGVWHSAGLAADGTSCLYLFLLGRPTKDTHQVDSGLVGFASGESVAIE
jgi:ureidoglycolate hydrolase